MEIISKIYLSLSHAAAYAFLAYRTAYLKCHYPNEYFSALISSVLDDSNKVASYISECNRLGIKIVPPDVNEGYDMFTVKGDDILFGMLAIKNLGRNAIRSIIKEREDGGKFESFSSFCFRMYGKDLNRRAIEALIYSGALDGLDLNRRQMITALPSILSEAENSGRIMAGGQMGLFGDETEMFSVDIPDLPEFETGDKLRYEKEFTGIYISGHPLSRYENVATALRTDKLGEILTETSSESENNTSKYRDNARVNVLAIVTSVKKKTTKNNDTMAFVTIEDTTSEMELIVFSKLYRDYGSLLSVGNVLHITGRLSLREDEECKLVCEHVAEAPRNVQTVRPPEPAKKENKGIYFKVKNSECEEYRKIQHILDVFDGSTPVYYYFTDTGKLVRHQGRLCEINNSMLKELKRIVGDENVGIK